MIIGASVPAHMHIGRWHRAHNFLVIMIRVGCYLTQDHGLAAVELATNATVYTWYAHPHRRT